MRALGATECVHRDDLTLQSVGSTLRHIIAWYTAFVGNPFAHGIVRWHWPTGQTCRNHVVVHRQDAANLHEQDLIHDLLIYLQLVDEVLAFTPRPANMS